MNRARLFTILLALFTVIIMMSPLEGQTPSATTFFPPGPDLPDLRKQAEIQLAWTRERLDTVLPALMRQYGIRMWLVICREYNEDPAFFSLVAPTTFAARRRTILVFYDPGPGKPLERLALGGSSQSGLYQAFRDPEIQERELWGEAQWLMLRKVIEERQPETIAVNISPYHAFADGLTVAEYRALQKALGPEWMKRVVPAGNLVLDYLMIRVPGMLPYYKKMMQWVHTLIETAFSEKVITPGKTSTDDVVWWLREAVRHAGYTVWFHPTVRLQRPGRPMGRIVSEEGPDIIQRGDVLHVDFGIVAMGLATDTQHMGYVLREGETEPPPGIQHALKVSNRLQDLLLERIRPGRSGNEILLDTLKAMKAEGIKGRIYSHPIGDRGHGAGPLIGLWDRQEPIPGRGDLLVRPQSWFSIELSVEVPVPEWDNQPLWIGQEEDAYLDGEGQIHWVLKRQTRYHLIR